MEPEAVTLTPLAPRDEPSSAGGSSPGQAPGEPITERKACDVTSCVSQPLEEKDEELEEASVAIAAN